ncbi:hypothetical protein ACFH4J_003417 [Escherichia coli]|uniref:hypothetical protein n=1 Tax=Enterobacter hormaechei TaxID=158836 RepID=UPI0027D228E9|nr:hypothetical protein [Enterobacter hormaechei]WLZ51922.1 hypothetical protein QPR65_22580 [Enterobacter hormaechei]
MTDQRNTIFVSINNDNNREFLHFSGIKKLSGHQGTLNFPFDSSKPIFGQVEDVMVINKMCHNVTSVERVDNAGDKQLYKVVYNRPVRKTKKS